METFSQFIQQLSDFVWGAPMILLLVGTHIFLTIRLKMPQRKLWKGIKLSVSPDHEAAGDVSPFGALATSLAATIGTGNIIGVATAISLGGPGAIFWCWLTGFFGIATKYGEGLLAIKYRVKKPDGEMLGGPMYALERGLGKKWLGILFCIFTAIAAFGIGNTVQANAISTNICVLTNGFIDDELCKLITGISIAIIIGLVIFGGVKSIARFCTALVPFMAVFYILGCIYILCINASFILPAIKWILTNAFSTESAVGGAAGSAIMMTMRYGVSRGLFSNESGLGSAPIVAAAAKAKNPARQALVTSTATFWDTVIICTLTGLVIVTSIMAFPDIDLKNQGLLTSLAFGKIPYIGTPLLTIGIVTFAFSTIIGWSYYAEKAVEYLAGKKFVKIYRILWVLLCVVGCVLDLNALWSFADLMNALMAIPNLIALVFLSGVIAKDTQYYLWCDNLDEEGK
ncbi:MAG: sodium:alanine symporter family protein [Prevotellaceae bacterium]|nr:sodium:alanine symporter family protein [Candidatus Colivivens caballi]